MQLEGLTVAVTGGAGFIGSHLVDQLINRGNRVVVIDNFSTGSRENLATHRQNKNLHVVECDVRELTSIEKAFQGVEVVFHLATHCVRLSLSEPVTNHEVNATGTLNALVAASKKKVKRFIYCSSSEVYGNVSADRPISDGGLLNEDSMKLPTTVYGASKLVGEHYSLAFQQTHGLDCMVVRPFNTYGPRSHLMGAYGEVIPRFAILIRAGKSPVIFGDGKQTRDFTYVQDTASGLIASAECDALLGKSVNLAFGKEVSVVELAQTLCELEGGKSKPKHIEDRPGDIRRLGADTTKAKKVLNWNAKVDIREGLSHYLKWLDSQKLDYVALASQLTEKNWEKTSESSK